MATFTVEVKWGKEVLKGVEVDTSLPPAALKAVLFSLTGVPPERQKVLGLKGGLLKDDAEWAGLGLKEGQKLTLMGSAGAVPEAPAAGAVTFLEDLPPEEQDTTGAGGAWGRRPAAKEGTNTRSRGGLQETKNYTNKTHESKTDADDARPSPLNPQNKTQHPQGTASTARGWRTWATRAT